MWNLYPFYLDLTGVYATNQSLKCLDHFFLHQTDGTCRRDERVMDWQGSDTFIVHRFERAEDQLAVDAHQAHPGVCAKGFADRLVALLDGGEQFAGVDTAYRGFVGKRTHSRALIPGGSVQC